MALMIPKLPDRLVLYPSLTDEEFEQLCMSNDANLSRTKEGVIIVNPPTGLDSGSGNSVINARLRTWWEHHRKGKVFDSSTGFFLPDGSTPKSPDAAYATAEQVGHLTPKQRSHFGRFAPAFVIELLSATDDLEEAQGKMENVWLANGVRVGWLIDPYRREVWVYEAGRPLARMETGLHVIGTGPVEGFTLSLADVWQEYE